VRVVIYCPDRHIVYDGETPYQLGVGGGITSRVRMARALSVLGHQVTMVANCGSGRVIAGVAYVPLDEVTYIDTDILILNTSGGALDLSPVHSLPIRAQLRILLVSGVTKPSGLEGLGFDWVYAKSNFLRRTVRESWGLAGAKVFVAYNGYDAEVYTRATSRGPQRDAYRITHISHPAKGIETSLAVLEHLRRIDGRYHLRVFGGEDLWGKRVVAPRPAPGVSYHGTIGQEQLAFELMCCGISICLHSIPEGFGNAVIESQRAGCIVAASAVGAQPELVRHGWNGIVVGGDHREEIVRAEAVDAIQQINEDRALADSMRRNAIASPLDTLTLGRAWSEHWALSAGHSLTGQSSTEHCRECGGTAFHLADGIHCLECGLFTPQWARPVSEEAE